MLGRNGELNDTSAFATSHVRDIAYLILFRSANTVSQKFPVMDLTINNECAREVGG